MEVVAAVCAGRDSPTNIVTTYTYTFYVNENKVHKGKSGNITIYLGTREGSRVPKYSAESTRMGKWGTLYAGPVLSNSIR